MSTAKSDSRRMVPVPGQPGIYERGNSYVVLHYIDGRERKKSFTSLPQAKRFKAKARAGLVLPSASMRFAEYAETWLTTYGGRTTKGVTDSTLAGYRDALNRKVVPYFRTKRLDAIKPSDLKAFIKHLDAEGLAPSTVKRYYAPLSALLATAYEDDLIPRNPAHGVRVIVRNGKGKAKRYPTAEEMRKLLAEIPPEHHDLTYLLAVTGCRISEALAPIWSEFGVDHDGRPTLIIPTSKTEAGIRTLALTPELARRLMARRNTSPFPADEHPIFPTMRGTRMDGHNWRQRVFNPARQRAGMPWMTPHKLRHGMATVMAERGKGADEIAKQLGHADGGTLALKTYIHRRTAGPTDYMDDVLIVN